MDPDGRFVDIGIDTGLITYDLYRLYKDGFCNLGENLGALTLDVLGAIVPGVTFLGPAFRTKHIANRHIDRHKFPDRSKFKKPSEIDKLHNRTVNNPDRVVQQSRDRTRFEKDFGRDIGTRGERTNVSVVNRRTNKRITQFPR